MERRTLGLMLVAALFGGFCGGAALLGLLLLRPGITSRLALPGEAGAATVTAGTVTARQFLLVDDKGRALATLRSWKDGTIGLVFLKPGTKLAEKSSSMFWKVGSDLQYEGAAGIVVSPPMGGWTERESQVFINGVSERGEIIGSVSLDAGLEGSRVKAWWRRGGSVVKMSAGDARFPKEGRASIELMPRSKASEPNALTPLKYARLDGDGLVVHDKTGKATVAAHAVSLSDLETITTRQALVLLGLKNPDKMYPPRLLNSRTLSPHGLTRATLGVTQLETQKTGALETTAPSSLTLFDKSGKVIWQAP